MEFVHWIDISKDILIGGQNILLGCTYIPPEFSKYSSDDSFIDLEEELLLFSQNTKNIAVLDAYVVIDENLHKYTKHCRWCWMYWGYFKLLYT